MVREDGEDRSYLNGLLSRCCSWEISEVRAAELAGRAERPGAEGTCELGDAKPPSAIWRSCGEECGNLLKPHGSPQATFSLDTEEAHSHERT